jgi:hypothetical protein
MFRFTIRDVLWLTVVAAFGVGWWCDRVSQRAEFQRQARVLGEIIESSKTEAARARESEAAIRQLLSAESGRPQP